MSYNLTNIQNKVKATLLLWIKWSANISSNILGEDFLPDKFKDGFL